MKITGPHRSIEFTPEAYQFPELSPEHWNYDFWDSNQLVIRFVVDQGFWAEESNACLLSTEMHDFIAALFRRRKSSEREPGHSGILPQFCVSVSIISAPQAYIIFSGNWVYAKHTALRAVEILYEALKIPCFFGVFHIFHRVFHSLKKGPLCFDLILHVYIK